MKNQVKYYTMALALLMVILALNMTKKDNKSVIKENVDLFGSLDIDNHDELIQLPVVVSIQNRLNTSSKSGWLQSSRYIIQSLNKGSSVIVMVDKKDLAFYSAVINVMFKMTPKPIIITSDKEDALLACTFLSKYTPSKVLTFKDGKILLPHQVSSLTPDIKGSNGIPYNQEEMTETQSKLWFTPINTKLNIRLIKAYPDMDLKVIHCSLQNADGIVIDNTVDEKIDLTLDDSIKTPIIIVGSTRITKFINEATLTPEDAMAMLYMHLTDNPPPKPKAETELVSQRNNRVKKGFQFRQ